MGRHLGIDFSWILVDFGRQVGRETGAKIDPKRHRKNSGKTKVNKTPKKSTPGRPTGAMTTIDPRHFGPKSSLGGGRGGENNPTTQMLIILTRHWAKGPANFRT